MSSRTTPGRAAPPGVTAPGVRGRALLLVSCCLVGVLALWWLFVGTYTGQRLEAAALEGSEIGSHYVSDQARALLSTVSMPAAVVLVAVILLVGWLRGSHRRALWAVVAVVGANLSTQVIKQWVLWRPDYDITARWDNANTLPSGHTTMAASAAVALVLLAGTRWRTAAAWVGAGATAAMGYSTLVCQWHRPSDVLSAVLVAVAWGAVAVAAGAWQGGDRDPDGHGGQHDGGQHGSGHSDGDRDEGAGGEAAAARGSQQLWNTVLTVAGAVGCAGAGLLEMWVWSRSAAPLTRWDLFAAYTAGSVATVAVSCLALGALVGLSGWRR
ncbi:phosphatase PAP2 family protein [Actinomyces lilanjuaniae]|uniref:Phosphatase PAP2 family protein n=1 Tax=Actinomyces lilanjuaniae TaxID=2321394 RepID=A0ABM6Z6W5_9ACTO|nr:phosphatase PAP2 family protein [Actinomyces lilanjuaniae]